MDSAAARWKRPWEEHSHPLPNHHSHHPREHCECTQHPPLPALPDEPERVQPWPSAGRHLYLAESLQSQADAAQNNKRRRLFSDQIPQPDPHLPRPPADSAGFHGSGEDYDAGRQQPPPASPGMSSFDARGFLPAVVSKDDGACCPSSCAGLACTRRRALISDIVAEVDTLNADIQRIILQGNSQPRSLSSGVANLGTDQVLVYALDLLRANVASLRDLTTPLSIPSGTGAEPQSAATAAATAEIRDVMKRRFDPIANQEVSHFLPRPTSGGDRTIPPPGPPEDVRRSFQGTLQTLRQEYDALLSKLDRQRTKCATLEKKFEVTDVEINGLTAEKEELEARVAALELQVEELREQRDDARRREVRTGEQYRSIVEMAGKLQGMAAEEKRAWAQEREGLLNALGWKGDEDGAGKEEERRLETGGVGGTFLQPTSSTAAITTNMPSVLDDPMRGGALFDAANPPLSRRDSEQHAPTPAAAAASSQVIAALRVEVAQLRSRTQTLETTIRSICDQGTRMEEASQTIAEAGRKMKEAAREAIGDR